MVYPIKRGETTMRDASYYVIFCHDQHHGAYAPERNQSDMDYDTTVRQIAAGEFYGVSTIIEFNPAENTSRDVTEDIALVVADRWSVTGEELTDTQIEFIECHLGVSTANSFRRAA
jgi:hypothetical protein